MPDFSSITPVQWNLIWWSSLITLAFCFGWLLGDASGKRERHHALIHLVKTLARELIASVNGCQAAVQEMAKVEITGGPREPLDLGMTLSELRLAANGAPRMSKEQADAVLARNVPGYSTAPTTTETSATAPRHPREDTTALSKAMKRATTRSADRRKPRGKK